MKECVTHHHACDCREAMLQGRIEALEKDRIERQKYADESEAALHQERIRADKLFDSAALMREALVRLRDCDWTITLPDRMDAVRDIARQALLEAEK